MNSTLYTGPLNTEIKGYVKGVKSGVCGCIQSNVTHVRGVESAYRVPQYRVMLLM